VVSSEKKPKKKIIRQVRQKGPSQIMKSRPAKKNKIELLNTYSKSITGQSRPNRHKTPIMSMRPINLNQQSRESLRIKDDENVLRISIKDTSSVKDFEDDELDMIIIDKADIDNDRDDENMFIVDLRENGSPTIAKDKEMPIFNISLDRNHGKKKITRNGRDNKTGKSMGHFKAKKPQPLPLIAKSTPKLEDCIFTHKPAELEKKESAHFGDNVGRQIDLSIGHEEDFGGQHKAEQNIISKSYKPIQANISLDTPKNREKSRETSGQVLMASTIEEHLKKTNDLINDAVDTIDITQVAHSQVDQKVQDYYLDQPQPKHERRTPASTKVIYHTPTSPTSIASPIGFNPIQDITPTALATRLEMAQKYSSPIRNDYEALIKKSQEETDIKEQLKLKEEALLKKGAKLKTKNKNKTKSKERAKSNEKTKSNEKGKSKELLKNKNRKTSPHRRKSENPSTKRTRGQSNSINKNIINVEITDLDYGLDEEHAKKIKDSANKLRFKMQSQALLATKKTIDLKAPINDSKYTAVKRKRNKSEISSSERSVRELKEEPTISKFDGSPEKIDSIASPSVSYYAPHNYDSKMTFSGKKYEERDTTIPVLEEKLHQAENMVLELQNKIDSNDHAYKEKYAKIVKEIQELEADNISLHQLVKSKMNEIQEFKNENNEIKHKMVSNNMITHKMNVTEEELRIKIEELMNKTTELNFLLRKKDEECQAADRKLKINQIDLNNAKNVEKSLINEIEEMRKGRDKISNEIQELKDENCQYQVSSREQK
jgi:hypothetical protein